MGGPGLRDLLAAAEMSLEQMFAPEPVESPSEIPVIGRIFRRGGRLGLRPKPIDILYDHYEVAIQRQNSVENPETPEEAKRRDLLRDATKSVSLLFHVRSMHKREKNRRLITKKASDLADRAIEALRYMDYETN